MEKELKPTHVQSLNGGGETWTNIDYYNLHDGILLFDNTIVKGRLKIGIKGCTNIEIPDTIKEISYLSDSTIKKWPNSISYIESIGNCIDIELPDSITEIGHIYSSTIKKWPKNIRKIGVLSCPNIDIPDSVESIGLCHILKHWPQNLTTIDYISGLSDFEFPDCVTNSTIKIYNSTIKKWGKSITEIREISKCYNLQIPQTINKIKCICECSNIQIPNSVRTITKLIDCNGIVIPQTINSLEAIYACRDITIPTGLNLIGRISGDCDLTIPSSVKSIKEIDGCDHTLTLRMVSKMPPVVGKIVNMSKDDNLIVPQGALNAYKNSSTWGKFKNITEDPSLNDMEVNDAKPTTISNPTAQKCADSSDFTQELSALKKQIASIDNSQKINELESKLSSTKSELATVKSELAAVKQQLAEFSKVFNEKIAKASSEQRAISSEPKAVKQESKAEPKVEQKPTPMPTPKQETKSQTFRLADYKFKGKMCLAIVKYYVEQHPSITLSELKNAFNVLKSDQVVVSLAEAMNIKDSAGKAGGNYYIKNDDQITLGDKNKVAVLNYWSERYFSAFTENVKKFGITVEI